MNNKILTSIKGTLYKTGFQLKKHSPEILVVAGVVGTVASAVMACRATTKINTILNESKADIDKIHSAMEDESLADRYSEEDGKKDLTIVYAQTAWKFVKLYAPAVLLGAMSITSIVTSNNILRKRNVALAAAYATVDRGFKEYRGRVIERFGEQVDRELKYNIKAKQFAEVVTDEDGNEKIVETTVDIVDQNQYSGYARFFDDGCNGWEKDSEYNLMFLKHEQNYANDRLRARGYLFLNEVYERLGIPLSKAGQVVGWIYDPDNPNIDNYVDFGIYDVCCEKTRDFVNGYERSILLDFNVDGNILDLIEKVGA